MAFLTDIHKKLQDLFNQGGRDVGNAIRTVQSHPFQIPSARLPKINIPQSQPYPTNQAHLNIPQSQPINFGRIGNDIWNTPRQIGIRPTGLFSAGSLQASPHDLYNQVAPTWQQPLKAGAGFLPQFQSPGVKAGMKTPIGSAISKVAFGQNTPLNTASQTLKKGVDIPIINKHVGGLPGAGLAAVGTGLAIGSLGTGAGEKAVGKDVVETLAKNSKNIGEFLQQMKRDPKLLQQGIQIIKDNTNKYKSLEDIYQGVNFGSGLAKGKIIKKNEDFAKGLKTEAAINTNLAPKESARRTDIKINDILANLREKGKGVKTAMQDQTGAVRLDLGLTGGGEKLSSKVNQAESLPNIVPQDAQAGLSDVAKPSAELGNAVPPSTPPSTPVGDPVQTIIQALREAKPLQKEQGNIYAKIRSQQAARVAAMGSKVPGEKGFFAQLGQLKGEMPKVQFESIRKQITQPHIDELFNQIEQAPLSPFEKVTAKSGLAKLLGAEGGQVPVQSELKLLNEVFPPEFTQAVLSKRSTMEKLFSTGQEVLNVPRSIMATMDLSAPLRQGVFLVGRPKQFGPAFGSMFKYAFSEKAYQGLNDTIKAMPTYPAMRESKLALTDMSPILQGREEAFMSNIAERIPGFGRVVKGSGRAYSGFLNKLRADTFNDLYKTAQSQGLLQERPQISADIAKFVNSATGRGDLGSLNRAATALNSVFFSPRLLASRLNMMNPRYYASLDPFVRKEALKSLFTFAGTAASVLTLAKLGGADVSADPRSADFGKIKIGNTRYDILGGFQQPIRLAGQLITGQKINSSTGQLMTLGEGYGKPTRKDILQQFFESKESPVASFVLGMLSGKNSIGGSFDLPVETLNRFIPLIAQDMYDLAKDRNSPLAALQGIPGVFGVGVQTYGKQIPTMETTASGNPTIKMNSVPGLTEDIVNKITGKQVSNIPQNQWQGIIDAKNQDNTLKSTKGNLTITGQSGSQAGNKIVYLGTNGKTKTIDLSSPTKGSGIGSFANSNWKATKAASIWNSDAPQNIKDQALKQLKVNPQDARYAALASYGTDISAQYIKSSSPDHDTLLNNLLTGRVVGITNQQFASNAVIDSLYNEGLLSANERKELKAVKLDKNGKSLAKIGTGKKAKKINLTIARSKAPNVKSGPLKLSKPPKIKMAKNSIKVTSTKSAPIAKFRSSGIKVRIGKPTLTA